MHTHKQMETGRKCFFLMMLVLYIVVVHQGSIFHQPRMCWQQMARTTRFWARGEAWEIRTTLVPLGFSRERGQALQPQEQCGRPVRIYLNLFTWHGYHMQLQPDMLESSGKTWMQAREQIFKGILHPKMKILSLFTHPVSLSFCKSDILRKRDTHKHKLKTWTSEFRTKLNSFFYI